MQPCANPDCTRWSEAEYCVHHRASLKLAECESVLRKPTRAYDALPEQVRGIGVITTRRVLAHRPRSVRRNLPVSIDTGFSPDMLRDMLKRGGTFGKIKTTNPTIVAEDHNAKLRQIARTADQHDYNQQ